MQKVLAKQVEEALGAFGIEGIEPVIEFPGELAHGDFATNAALAAAKAAGMNPKELAEKLVAELGEIDNIEKIEIAGPGFINFHLTRDYFTKIVSGVDEGWGEGETLKGKKIMVEYAQPNPFKPFHIGHLMSTTIGESISRLVEKSGAKTFRANYQGDIGLHIAKALWAIENGEYNLDDPVSIGDAYAYGHEQFEKDEKTKEEIIELNKKVAAKDSSIQELYETGYKTSMDHFEELYALLNTKFDHYFFESEALPIGLKEVEKGKKEKIFEEGDEGALVFKGEEFGLHTRVFVTKYGTTTYETRDLGLPLLKKKEFDFDTSITTTAVEQKSYFEVVFKVFNLLNPEFKGELKNVTHGMMQLTSGKMSSRKGNVITGESLINDMREMALEKMSDRELSSEKQTVADMVGVAAIKYVVLRQSLNKDIAFDPEASLSFEGNSGPYLQYSYARAKSVLEKAGGNGSTEKSTEITPEFERLLPRFPAVVERAASEYEPHYVTTYLTELASAFNSWYAQEKIIGAKDEQYKLALTRAFAQTMKNGLWLLGISAPEKM